MTRLTVFLTILVGFILVLTFHSYRNIPVLNEKFDFGKVAKEHEEHVKLVAELTAPKKEVEVVEVKEVEIKIDLNTPELVNGNKVYSKCIACHGKNGEGKASQKAPRIAGQFDWYIEKQVTDMKSGARINELMMPTVKGLSAQDIKDVSLYVSKLPWKLAEYEAAQAGATQAEAK